MADRSSGQMLSLQVGLEKSTDCQSAMSCGRLLCCRHSGLFPVASIAEEWPGPCPPWASRRLFSACSNDV